MDEFFGGDGVRQGFSGFAGKLGQRFVFGARSAVCLGGDGTPMQIDFLGHQLPVVQPQAITPGKIAVHGGKLQLQSAILVPGALNTRAVNHPIFAQQPTGFAPLAADAVQQTILVRLFVSQHTVLVPHADNAMPATVAQRHYFTELAIPMKGFFNRLFHKAVNVSFTNKPIKYKNAKKNSMELWQTR